MRRSVPALVFGKDRRHDDRTQHLTDQLVEDLGHADRAAVKSDGREIEYAAEKQLRRQIVEDVDQADAARIHPELEDVRTVPKATVGRFECCATSPPDRIVRTRFMATPPHIGAMKLKSRTASTIETAAPTEIRNKIAEAQVFRTPFAPEQGG